ncbi:MAG: SGNH/GDSL hydrolase family protein [Bacteroidota bacterium]
MWAIILLTMALGACNKEETTPPNPSQTTMDSTSTDSSLTDTTLSDTSLVDTVRFTYLALGDSYTIGTALPDSSEAYPIQLVERLNEDSLLEGTTPDIVAFGGWRTDQLINGIDTAELNDSYTIVSLLIGVNNQFQNRPDSVYALEFEELLQTAIQFASGESSNVFVLSIPDYGVTPFGNNYPNASEEVDQFNDTNREITENYEISYFNITYISRLAENDLSLLAPDNLHPSGEMYTLWVEEIIDEVKSKLYE